MRLGPFAAGGHVKLPHVMPWGHFEGCTIGVGLAIQFGPIRHEVFNVYVQADLPGRVADALVVVWPGVGMGERRAAVGRVLS